MARGKKIECQHELDWDKVWLPAKLYIKDVPGIMPSTRVVPLTKYWHGICLKCDKEITEVDIPYKQDE